MKKNVASQTVGAQMVSASDGSEFTGSVTVYVTGDGGTQAVGSVGSGACAHEGHGYHSYAPAQAETNYDHVAFTFVGTGAVPQTVHSYPTFPQTGDNYAIVSSGTHGNAALKAILDTSGVVLANGAIATAKIADGALTAAKFAAGAFDAVWSVAERLLTAGTNIVLAKGTGVTGLNDLDAAGVRTAVGLATANLDTQIGDLPTSSELTTALGSADDAMLTAISGVPAAVLAAAETDPIAADIHEINDVVVQGAGASADKWRPV